MSIDIRRIPRRKRLAPTSIGAASRLVAHSYLDMKPQERHALACRTLPCSPCLACPALAPQAYRRASFAGTAFGRSVKRATGATAWTRSSDGG